jgi:two-component system chemotaxis sensor kinase CheA
MAAIKQTFFQECEEQLAELESGLLAIEAGDHDSEMVNAVFRAVHSVKGGAGAFSLEDLVRFAHVFETALDHVRAGRLEPTPDVLKVLLRAADVLADLVRVARDGGTFDESRSEKLTDELRALNPGDAAEPEDDLSGLAFQPVQIDFDLGDDDLPAPAENVFTIKFKPKPSLYAKANETALILRELGELGAVETSCDISDLPLLSELDPEGAYLSWTIKLTTPKSEDAVREVFDFVTWDCDLEIVNESAPAGESASGLDDELAALLAQVHAAPAEEGASPALADEPVPMPVAVALAPPAAAGLAPVARAAQENAPPAKAGGGDAEAKPTQTIRVDLDRVDRLIDLVGELVINQAMLAQRVNEAGLARASGVVMGLDELEQLTREIQDNVMAIRAQPVKSVFQRMPRLVRELAAMTGKSVRLLTDGEGTEVDKTVIERLTDPSPI